MASLVYFEFGGHKIDAKKVEEKVKAIWKDAGNKVKDIKKMEIYFKAEEGMFYYVINEGVEDGFYIGDI